MLVPIGKPRPTPPRRQPSCCHRPRAWCPQCRTDMAVDMTEDRVIPIVFAVAILVTLVVLIVFK